jgi:two-component sensor histidine kinase
MIPPAATAGVALAFAQDISTNFVLLAVVIVGCASFAASYLLAGRWLPRRAPVTPEAIALEEALSEALRNLDLRNHELDELVARRNRQVRETHHLVKNNLQTVSSLLNLQVRSATGTDREFLVKLQNRIGTLTLVHQNLREAEDLTLEVSLPDLFASLCSQLSAMRDEGPGQVVVSNEIAPASVSANTAVTLAMFLTEAVMNAFDHAFPGARSGCVSVRLHG